jgi:hypothetical protein
MGLSLDDIGKKVEVVGRGKGVLKGFKQYGGSYRAKVMFGGNNESTVDPSKVKLYQPNSNPEPEQQEQQPQEQQPQEQQTQEQQQEQQTNPTEAQQDGGKKKSTKKGTKKGTKGKKEPKKGTKGKKKGTKDRKR